MSPRRSRRPTAAEPPHRDVAPDPVRRVSTWPAALLLLLCGCELGYYAHLARGQADIVLHCQPLDEAAADTTLPSHALERLHLVLQIRRYAGEVLGLNTADNYTCFYDTGKRPVCWNVSASPKDRLEPYHWHFPFLGDLPYKGYFDLDRAQRERQRLEAEGYDVLLRPVTAYSTLGYFSDPVLSDMLRFPEDALAELLLHELTHATIYARGHTDFNESLATFVGRRGSLDFLAAAHGDSSQAVRAAVSRRRDAALFRDVVASIVDDVEGLYALELPREEVLRRREQVWEAGQARYRQRRDEFAQPERYDGLLEWEINNARLLSYRRYNRDLELFERLRQSRQGRLADAIDALRPCGEATDPWACARDLLPE